MPTVTLISWTQEPLKVIYNCFMNMHNEIPSDLSKVIVSKRELADFMEMLVKQPHQTVFEFVNTVWKIDGASRSFQQQLTRTRDAAYSIQSLRIVNVGNFAKEGRYTKSYAIESRPEIEQLYDETMLMLQDRYRKLISLGCPIEDARGILPLNIHSPITMAINLRSLYHMTSLRFCENAQAEYREVAKQMRDEISIKMHPLLAKPMVPICISTGKCPSPVPCNKYPNIEKTCKMDVSRWIHG